MDHRRTFAGGLIIAGAALIGAAAPVFAPEPTLRAERWLAPDQRLASLTTMPAVCFQPLTDGEAPRITIGSVAFRTPNLLGGQAARSGLSCASCHSNGRRTAGFSLPGISDGAGTADVTSSILSSHRGNGVFDPVLIPDLALPGKVSRATGDPALQRFVRGLIVEEFDGAPPSEAVMLGLLAYLRTIAPCLPERVVPITLETHLADVDAGLAAARLALASGDIETTRLMLGGARSALGQIDERYAAPGLASERAGIVAADRALGALQRQLDTAPDRAKAPLARWTLPPKTVALLRATQPTSFYDRAKLDAAIRR